MAENNNIVIPENADKILFAEDLIRYVMLRKGNVPYPSRRAGPYREFIYNGFNKTTEMAVWFLDRSMAMGYCRKFHHLENISAVNHEMYAKLANDVIQKFFPAGFTANRFLHFCVHVASLAAYFYTNGVTEALDLAVLFILKPIQDIDMTAGGWDTVNSIAQMYAKMARDSVDKFSPESVISDQDVVEADIAPEGDRDVPEANNLGAVPGEANRHAAQNYVGPNDENGETRNNYTYDEKSD